MNTQSVIYIVDDDASVLRALRRLIKAMGFTVETFASAEDFLQSGHRKKRGCLILDIQLPGMDGFDLQKRLAASDCRIPLIFITAHEDTKVRVRALEAGAAFLQKPFDEQALLNAINTALGLSAVKKSELKDSREE